MAIRGVVDHVCATCAGGRQHRESMTGTREKVKDLLQCVHSDICGPMQAQTHSGERYFATFVDEASGRIAVALLKGKHQVLENFMVYRNRAEKETGKKYSETQDRRGRRIPQREVHRLPQKRRDRQNNDTSIHPRAEWDRRTSESHLNGRCPLHAARCASWK